MTSPVPVALFAYARPAYLHKVLESLKRNHVPLVHAYSDGPRNADQESRVAEVRQILRQIDWCDLTLVERERNYGLGPSIRDGVSRILSEHDRVIVVEDDIVLRPGAYDYVVAALKQFENNSRIMTISMWNHPSIVPDQSQHGFFSRRFVCWGWGTYEWAWKKYDRTPLDLYHLCEEKNIRVLDWGKDIKWQAEHAAERNLWYVGYALTHFLWDKVSYFPEESLTINIGRGPGGENMSGGTPDDISKMDIPVSIPNTWPEFCIFPGLERRFASYFEGKPVPVWKKLGKMAGLIKNFVFNGSRNIFAS